MLILPLGPTDDGSATAVHAAEAVQITVSLTMPEAIVIVAIIAFFAFLAWIVGR
jgi:hypothetical protein